MGQKRKYLVKYRRMVIGKTTNLVMQANSRVIHIVSIDGEFNLIQLTD